MARIKLEDIALELEQDGWKVLSDKYENLDSEMIFECNEGHKVFAPWKKIRHKRECPICKTNIYKEQDTKIIPKKKGSTRTLALDQSTRITGWSVYDDTELIKYGIFQTGFDDEIKRDNAVKVWLINMINNWQPDYVGLEGIQYQQNMGVTTFEMLARLQGILMEALYELNIPYMVCPTPTWRAHCKVKGKTRVDKKKSMQLIAKRLFDVSVTDDEADAIGIGKYVSEFNQKQNEIIEWE